jgi:radical SAM superfamily enzyme YgiQ (UPF0313 family)
VRPERDFALLRRETMAKEAPLPGSGGGPGPVRAVVLYPGPYKDGMASLSVHVLLDLFNREPCEAERAFLFPEATQPVRTLESGSALGDTHVILATVPFEMQFPTLTKMLEDSGVPALARERGEENPIVIAGGPAVTMNAAPVAAIADLVYVGEVEARADEIRAALGRSTGKPRTEIIEEVAAVPGMVDCAAWMDGRLKHPIEVQHVGDVNAYVPRSMIVAGAAELRGRALIEVSRGCPHWCRFCLARQLQHPFRPRSVEVVAQAMREVAAGAKEVGLIAADFLDHPQAAELVEAATAIGLKVSVSSLRMDRAAKKPRVLELLRAAGQRTITMAPEAAREPLRTAIGKPISHEVFMAAIDAVVEAGFPRLKLYFMLGLPGEVDEDAEALGELLAEVRVAAPEVDISASASCFVPKAGTVFEDQEFADQATLQRRTKIVKRAAAKIGVKLETESPRLAMVQAILARGGFEMGELIASEEVRDGGPAALLAAMAKAGMDAEEYARVGSKERPWRRG